MPFRLRPIFRPWLVRLLLALTACVAIATSGAYAGAGAYSVSSLSKETAICTVVTLATVDAQRPLQSGNPVESMAYLPTVCTSQIMSRAEIRDGVRSLLALGWRMVNTSHQVTAIRPQMTAGSGADILISATFVLERDAPTSHYR